MKCKGVTGEEYNVNFADVLILGIGYMYWSFSLIDFSHLLIFYENYNIAIAMLSSSHTDTDSVQAGGI